MTPNAMPQPAPAVPPAPLGPAELDALTRTLGEQAGQLTELMTVETTLLRTRRIPGPPELQQEKLRLSGVYAQTCAVMKANQAGFAALPAPVKQATRVLLEKLQAASDDNSRALHATKAATERVVNIVVRAVREQRVATVGYTRHSVPPRRVPGGLGLALDRSF